MRAIVIEDDPAVAAVVCRGLQAHGFTVERASDGEQALELSVLGKFDICLLDLNLPGISGLETLDRLRERAARPPPTIVLTGEATMQAAVASMRHGAADFITKPFTVAELLKSVDLALSRAAMERENAELRRELTANRDSELLGDAPSMRAVIGRARRAARTSASVLITGDTGTGKSLLARKIHEWSDRSSRPFVAISCASLPADLVESELFGHEKGAFTGATARREGRFELAASGTLLLDEIGEMPLALQPKLLRVLQSGEFEPIGSKRTVVSDARIIAATNRDLERAIARGVFREDLYFRLNVVVLRMPRLCERPGDTEMLAISFAKQFARIHGKVIEGIDPDALSALRDFDWPGNVRQLRNAIERAIVFAEDTVLRRAHLEVTPSWPGPGQTGPEQAGAEPRSPAVPLNLPLAEVERLVIAKVLEDSDGSREVAAQRLGISASTLYRRIRRYRELGRTCGRRTAA